ncbi:uncharacterized protein LOC110856300 [Folsomia candida]|uniref:Protein orai-2 n=1 Tax=Folsomia candida TaxID=158441 RepID=A0A226DMM1_FOLCA|nr:uncharacterized protein LOC110856300 [Folsomia candida]OXA46429.1 Protein orai-2 [Folsomia candida]
MGTLVPFSRRSRVEQVIFLREVHLRKARLHSATDLSVLFALFAMLGAVDLNINTDNDTVFVFAYVITTALLVSNTVLVKVGLLWMVPGLDSALLLGRFDPDEYDHVLPLFLLWDWLWILASTGGFFLFVMQFIFIIWIKFPTHSVAPTVIMSPVLLIVLVSLIHSVRRLGKPIVNVEKVERELDHLHGV